MYGIKRRGCVKNVMNKSELLNIQQWYESECINFKNALFYFQFNSYFSLKHVKLFLYVLEQQSANNQLNLLHPKFGIFCLKKLKPALH